MTASTITMYAGVRTSGFLASDSIVEGGFVKEIQRVSLSSSTGSAFTEQNPLHVEFSNYSSQLDAFGRLRTSTPQVLGYGSFEYGRNAFWVETAVGGSGAVADLPNESSISLTPGSGTINHYAYAQTRVHHRYVPGRSQLVRFTGLFGTPTANVRQRAGYFNDRNGFFIEYDGTTLYFVRRTYTGGSAVDTRVARSAWTDPLDGSGPSGLTIDFTTKTWLCWIDMEWLGVGRYRFGFASPTTGELVTCYAAAGTNVLALPYMTTANLPVRYEIYNTAAAAATITMKWICYSVDTEGGDEGNLPIQNSVDSGTTATALASGSYRPILAIRADSVVSGGSVPNRGQIIVRGISVMNTGNQPINVQVRLNPGTLTQAGGAITWANAGAISESAAFTNAADTIATGTLIDSFYVNATATAKGSASQDIYMRLPLVYTQLGSVQDVLAISAAGLGGTSSAYASIVWSELY
jgi:hypothetical protein